uniref:Uncharacterized protein n=1 Tax=Candidatus Kentrum sp. TC TaxID=2126339 RepID=A0A450Y7D2_9GAMM|nr:MAG: hypothetical protein BECKTC1821D_GA0114238_100182 [Candidatus Kentron sp. TC]
MLALRARIQTGYSLRGRRFFGIFIFPKPEPKFHHHVISTEGRDPSNAPGILTKPEDSHSTSPGACLASLDARPPLSMGVSRPSLQNTTPCATSAVLYGFSIRESFFFVLANFPSNAESIDGRSPSDREYALPRSRPCLQWSAADDKNRGLPA